jgi:centrosomal protein CEP110
VPSTPIDLQRAVSSLAMQQQESLQELLRMQEIQRMKLREEFQAKQQLLVQEIIGQFPALQINNNQNSYAKFKDKEQFSSRVVRSLEQSFSRQDSCIYNEVDTLDNISICSSISTTYAPEIPKKVVRSETFKISQEKIMKMPADAYLPQYQKSWDKLTAIARGFLTRRLMATEKVQMLKRTIQESVSCAVQLHLESEGPPSRADLDLHARLLAQLESACHSLHDIFFRLGIPERMAILALNRSAMQGRVTRSHVRQEKRVSSATEARMKAKENPSPRPESWNGRRRRAVKDAIKISNNPALLGYARIKTKVVKSPRRMTNRKKRSVSTSRRSSIGLSPTTMPQPYKEKPTWK